MPKTKRREDRVPLRKGCSCGPSIYLGPRMEYLYSPRLPPQELRNVMYKGQSGMWSWLLHRITGLGVLLFLLIHIVDISLLGFGPKVYNEGIALFSLTIVRILSLALIGGLLYHSFNGVRIMLIDFWPKGARYQGTMFVVVMVLTIVCFLPMAYYVIAPVFGINPVNIATGM